jgi:hypothetical protein
MDKRERNIAIGVLLLLLLIYYYRNQNKKSSQDPIIDDLAGGDSSSGGGGGAGGDGGMNEVAFDSDNDDNFTSTGTDDVDSQAGDPFSPVTTSKGDSDAIVGDVTSGLSGKPAIGTPIQTTVKSGRRRSGRKANPSQQRLVRGYAPRGGSSFFK